MLNTSNNQSSQKSKPAIRAYLGGSFDPVHNGHLQMAMYVYEYLLPIAKQAQRELYVSLLPNARSPFKEDSTDPEQRLAMLKLATQDTPLQINELELWQTPPVYTIDSVQTLRARYPHDSLIFIMGMDSARSLDKWKDGLTLTNYVNLWIFNRNDYADINKNVVENNVPTQLCAQLQLPSQLKTQLPFQLQTQLPMPLQPFVVDSIAKLLTPNTQNLAANSILKDTYKGHIYIDSRPVATISSTQIRQQLQQTPIALDINAPYINTPDINALPINTISINTRPLKHNTQTQTASIAPINDIMGHTASNPSAKWLNPAVYQYIIAHQLYSAAQFR